MNVKNIIVMYSGDDWGNDNPGMTDSVKRSFEDWNNRGIEQGIHFFRASIDWYDLEKNVFLKTWSFRNGFWQKNVDPVKPDLIFDKTTGSKGFSSFDFKQKIFGEVPIFNDPSFRIMFDSKLSQALIFKDQMALTYLILDESDYQKSLKKLPGDKIVIKPIYGTGGDGILIGRKDEIKTGSIKYPSIAQEFIEITKGVPGVSEKEEVADLRIVYLNHKPVYSLSRIAKDGSYFTNFRQGAKAVIVPENKIPESVNKLASIIIDKISIFSYAHYSLDFIFKNNGEPVLVEINTTPGFSLLYMINDQNLIKDNFDKFIQAIDGLIK